MRTEGWRLLVVLLALIAAGGQVRNDLQSPLPTSVIRGRVLGANSDTPLRNALVTLITDAGPSVGRIAPVYSDADGWFVIAAVPDGHFLVRIAKAGYASGDFGGSESGH